MKKNRLVLFFALVSLIALGCGGAGARPGQYTRGPMPEGGNFDGVYQSDFGRLELTVDSNGKAVGLYENNDKYGRIEGTVSGNLLLFSWTQWNVEMRGKTRETKGEGVFQYVLEQVATTSNNKAYHQLKGWWGYGRGKMVNPWNAYKLGTRARKKLKPYKPTTGMEEDAADAYNTSVGFDDSAQEPGPQEAAPPAQTPAPAVEEQGDDDNLDIF